MSELEGEEPSDYSSSESSCSEPEELINIIIILHPIDQSSDILLYMCRDAEKCKSTSFLSIIFVKFILSLWLMKALTS